MKKIFALMLSAITTVAAFAQKENFGIVNYTVPPGYQLLKSDNVLNYYKLDEKSGTYCKFMIYTMLPGQGGPKQNFDFFWDNMLRKAFNVTGTADMQPAATLKGWQLTMGSTIYPDNNINTMVILSTFSGENTMQNICILCNSDTYKKDIEDFIASVDISKDITSTSSQKQKAGTVSNNVSSTGTATTASAKNIKYDLWMCHCLDMGGRAGDLKFKTVVLSPDGRCLYYMPEKGLNGVTPQNSNETGSWGMVTDKGNKLSLVNSKSGNMELYKITSTSMSRYPNSSSSIYKKMKQVDGLRFEGAYSPELSYYNGKPNIISGQIDPNKRPIIFFKKDGTYINEGIAFSNLTFGDDFAIGKGTYEIVNYSLILTTQTGKKLQVAFTPILDANPASDNNSGLMINNNLFYRLNKTFVPHK